MGMGRERPIPFAGFREEELTWQKVREIITRS